MPLVYKILPSSLWDAAALTGLFKGAGIDVADGYIHFSTAAQMRETAAKHFARQTDLVLFAVDGDKLGSALKYEVSRGGDLFPHLYAPLNMADVAWMKPLPLDADGNHVFPADAE
ncbi:MAG: DUF952 domain-containing protein [Rhizobiaceae bacterium]